MTFTPSPLMRRTDGITVDTETGGNGAYFFVHGIDLDRTDENQEKAEEAAREHAETFCREWRETYPGDSCWIVVWDIH